MPGTELAHEWYIAYTFPKSEKKLCRNLTLMGVDSFLPVQKVVRKWSDRVKKLEEPLFPNYVFIYTSAKKRFEVLQLREMIRYVSFSGKPATVPQLLIDTLKKISNVDVEIGHGEFQLGMPVIISQGPFAGVAGKLTQKNGKSRLIIEINVLQRYVSVDIHSNFVIAI